MKHAIFGGSFNPPHTGHVLTACYLSLYFDKVTIPVTYSHAFEKALESFNARFWMCKLAMQNLSNINVSDIEYVLSQENKKSYTYDTVVALKKHYPHHEFSLALGTDTYNDLIANKWYRSKELIELAKPFVVDRTMLMNISSTTVREAVKLHDDETLEKFVPPSVMIYIKRVGLYL